MLGLQAYGSTAGSAPRPLGSILTDADALKGYNFTSVGARLLYARRRAAGWGVDPVRCTKYLTSSQGLTLNLLGPLDESPLWAGRALGLLMDRPDYERVTKVWVEFAPRRRSEYLNDMTRVDALLEIQTSTGAELLVLETKYADRFNSRRVDIDRPPYRDLAERLGVWRDPEALLRDAGLNQLVRCHALAAAVADDLVRGPFVPKFLVVHHREDAASRVIVDEYASHLSDRSLVLARTLDEFVNALRITAATDTQRAIVRALQLRYIAEVESDSAWQASGDRSLSSRKSPGSRSKR